MPTPREVNGFKGCYFNPNKPEICRIDYLDIQINELKKAREILTSKTESAIEKIDDPQKMKEYFKHQVKEQLLDIEKGIIEMQREKINRLEGPCADCTRPMLLSLGA
jgi:hypothetical protein